MLSLKSYQPFTMTQPMKKGRGSREWLSRPYYLGLCHRKRLMFFSLKFQGNNRQNAPAMKSAKGKTGEKRLYFYRAVGDETAAYDDRALFFRLCPRIWLFHLHSMVKKGAVSFIFPLIGSMVGGFHWLFRWSFEK